mmetsp:Transcript_9244/g.14185  ORF Transcript_9244/g.14185 Transcript_9244/m.14185 type:complete len:163 (-) Transcript_9244:159-647(-)
MVKAPIIVFIFMSGFAAAFLKPPSIIQHRQNSGHQLPSLHMSEGSGNFITEKWGEFQEWQNNLIKSRAKSNPKFEEYVEQIMTLEKVDREEAEKLATRFINDPIGYMGTAQQNKAKAEGKAYDINKVSGFFPMEWIMSGDFGWGYNRKRQRLQKEKEEQEGK